MKFTEEEIKLLKKRYPSIGEYGTSWSTNQGFGYGGIKKNEDGKIKYYWSTPRSVDPDDVRLGGMMRVKKYMIALKNY